MPFDRGSSALRPRIPTPRSSAAISMLIAAASLPLGLIAQDIQQEDRAPARLETIRNFQVLGPSLASAGQIGYDQVPRLAEEGYQVVVNLAVADEERNAREGFLVTRAGLTYVHIPVDWQSPRMEDVEIFFDVMEANEGRKIFVHCFANMRASAFLYLYRTLVQGVPEEEARATMNEVWDPDEFEQWAGLIERAMSEHGR